MPDTTSAETAAPLRGGLHPSSLRWRIIVPIAALHLIALLAVWPALFSWSGLVIFAVMCWVSGGIGITLGFHRMLTHRSFKCPKWLEYGITLCGCLAWQGNPAEWVGMHRLHHKHSDTDHDPHSPRHGFDWAHILWMLHDDAYGFKGIDAAKDLLRDPVFKFIDDWFYVPQLILAAALLGVGWWWGGWELGLGWVVWGVALRTVVVFHGTWFVNSAAHTWGYQNYETGEQSTNLWWVALVSFGEGWHNNHHKHPRSAAHGLRWFELDTTWWLIKGLSAVGLVWDVKLPERHEMPREVRLAEAKRKREEAAAKAEAARKATGGVGAELIKKTLGSDTV